jgi:RimJ/RimL family protein N-acetyltransferase
MTYQIHHYPAELIDVVRLADRQRVLIRPVLPQDHELLAVYFHDLSAQARCNRFMHPVSEPSSALLEQLTQVDYATHVGLIAELIVNGRETVVGEACYVRGSEPQSAVFALSVAERRQGQGLATLMLAKLAGRAAAAGIRQIVGEVLATNERMLALARKTGFAISHSLDAHGVMRIEKTLASQPDRRRCTLRAA